MANWTEEAADATLEIESWRRDQLARAGFSPQDAELLAGKADVDLHVAIELVEHGCEPDLAVRILI